ncbi:MAG: hypothetical protein GYB31_16615 [Bacteroidetes bacterium]|nr:hypothetical protein [Bacteroidota bacterium]
MDVKSQAKKYGYEYIQGKSITINHKFKKQPYWFGVFAIAYGFFKLAVNPSPIFGAISIICGVAILVIGSIENKKTELRDLGINKLAAGNNKLAVQYKNERVSKYTADDVDRLDVSFRRAANDKQVGTLSVFKEDGSEEQLLKIIDSDQQKMQWFLNEVAKKLAEKLNEEPATEPGLAS